MFEGMTTDEKIAYCEKAISSLSKTLEARLAEGHRTSSEARAERAIEWYKKAIEDFKKEQNDE